MKPKELYHHIGIVFQNPANQFVTQNVEDEVCVGLRLWEPGLSDEACRQRAEELLDRYGLKRQRRYSPYMLSQGQQRRLAVLSVLAGGQELLLLDEPTYGQDARSVNAIMEHLREKVEQEGLTVIFITHDTELVAAWARSNLPAGRYRAGGKIRRGGAVNAGTLEPHRKGIYGADLCHSALV